MSKETPRKESLWTESTNKDYCTISTILEELIFVFDDDAQFAEKSRIDRLNRMRLALTVLGDSGYARLMSTTATTPMAVPTAKLSIVLDHDYLTTDVEPLIVPPLNADVCNSEGMSHSEYMQAFSSAMTNGMAGYVQVQTAILHMWAVGLLCHRRAAGGELEWIVSKKACRDGMFRTVLKAGGFAESSALRNMGRGKHIPDISMRLPDLVRRLR